MNSTTETSKPWGSHAPGSFLGFWLKILHSLPSGRAWRRLALWLRKPAKCALKEWIDLPLWGLKLRLRSRGNLSEQRMILMPQFLDQTEFQHLSSQLANGGIFLDIGANAGAYSFRIASLKIPNTRIEAFEPDPELCERMSFNIRTNSLSSISINQLALGRSKGTINLFSQDGNKGQNQIQSADHENAIPVSMTTLPTFISEKNISQIDALKIDIEGYEYEALEPLFLETPPTIWPKMVICEFVHDQQDKLAALLEKNGYKLIAKGRLNGIYLRSV